MQFMADAPQPVPRDIRMEGFAGRASVSEAIAWVDRHAKIREAERVALGAAVGRLLAEPFVSPADGPPTDTAVSDGYALRSCETVGADSYNPLPFCLQDNQSALRPFSAALIASGTPLPMGADAVAPFDLAQAGADTANLIGSVARGEGVSVKGQEARMGTTLIETSRPLRASDIGLLASFGIKRVRVVRRPLVRIILAGRKQAPGHPLADANGPMLRAHVVRDSGTIEICQYGIADRDAMAEWIARPGADLVLICGRTGAGPDDEAPLALAACGTLDLHGIAVRPGGSVGMGSVGEIPIVLLPGNPLDCLCAYDLFAGRLIRNLSGRSPRWPYRARQATLKRKIVSSVGTVELCRVLLIGGDALPMGTADAGGLASVARADGFILIPAPLEGYAPGATVDVYTYDEPLEAEGA
jgi:molybdopterin molybdotransferase